MAVTCTSIQVTTPPAYDDIYQDYHYCSIVLYSIMKDIQLFQIYCSMFKKKLA